MCPLLPRPPVCCAVMRCSCCGRLWSRSWQHWAPLAACPRPCFCRAAGGKLLHRWATGKPPTPVWLHPDSMPCLAVHEVTGAVPGGPLSLHRPAPPVAPLLQEITAALRGGASSVLACIGLLAGHMMTHINQHER